MPYGCPMNAQSHARMPQSLVTTQTIHHPSFSLSSSFLLPRRHRLCLRRFLPVTPDHNHAQETAHDGRAKQYQDDGYADGPDARWKEVVQGVAGVDERLWEGERVSDARGFWKLALGKEG